MDYFELAKEIGIDIKQTVFKIILFFGGCAGAFVSFSKDNKMGFVQRLSAITAGGLTSMFLTPVTKSFLKLGDSGMLFMCFIIGYSGFKSIDFSIEVLRNKFGKK